MKQVRCRTVWAAIPVCLAAGLAVPALGQPCGQGWVLRSSGAGPAYPNRLVYDSVRSRVVYFGEFDSNTPPYYFTNTWEWDGQAWALRATTGPSGRGGFGMAFDGAHVILFGGGLNAHPPLGDTWQWDGVVGQWTQLSPPVSPSPRFQPAMVYDPIRQVIVLFGGNRYFDPASLSDTWEWSRVTGTWAQQNIAGPACTSAIGAYDAERSRVMVCLGGGAPSFWTRSSAGNEPWQQFAASFWPGFASGMAFDESRNTVVVSGSGGIWEIPPGNAAWQFRGTNLGGHLVFDATRARTLTHGNQQTREWEGLQNGPAILANSPWPPIVNIGGFATMSVTATGPGLSYQWRRGSQPLSEGGPFSGVHTDTLTIGPAAMNLVDQYSVVVSNTCGSIITGQFSLQVFCWANCDQSTSPPVFNANDFNCYLNKFAASDPSANCDNSTAAPILNANDFNCFMNKFAAQSCD